MRNLWICLVSSAVIFCAVLIYLMVISIKRVKFFWLWDIIVIPLLLFAYSDNICIFKDMKYKELISFKGTYTKQIYHATEKAISGSENVFVDENKREDYLMIPSIVYSQYGLKKGKTYHITYYKNSHVVYSVAHCDGTETCVLCD